MTHARRRDQVQKEFEQFVADSADDLLRTAYSLVWDLTAAEDLVQECLWQTARRWPRVRSMAYPKAYARRVLVNLALDGADRRQRHLSELDERHRLRVEDSQDETAARAMGIVDSTSELIDALGALAPRQRAALVFRYFEDLSEAQVAELMGCSVGTIKSTTSRALDRLRHVLATRQVGDDSSKLPGKTDTNGVNDVEPATRI